MVVNSASNRTKMTTKHWLWSTTPLCALLLPPSNTPLVVMASHNSSWRMNVMSHFNTPTILNLVTHYSIINITGYDHLRANWYYRCPPILSLSSYLIVVWVLLFSYNTVQCLYIMATTKATSSFMIALVWSYLNPLKESLHHQYWNGRSVCQKGGEGESWMGKARKDELHG